MLPENDPHDDDWTYVVHPNLNGGTPRPFFGAPLVIVAHDVHAPLGECGKDWPLWMHKTNRWNAEQGVGSERIALAKDMARETGSPVCLRTEVVTETWNWIPLGDRE